MAGVSSPVTVSAGLAVELYLVRISLDEHSADSGTDETILANLSVLEACLEKAISLTLGSADGEFWRPIRHWEERGYFWPELAATIVDPCSKTSVAQAAFRELVWRLRFLTTKLKGKYKWDVFDVPQDHVLSGFQIVFSEYGRIHIKIGSQWSVKVWEIELDGYFLEIAGIRENLEFVKEKCEIINEMRGRERERPYDIMLNWLVGRPDMASVESFQVKSAGISKTISLELEVATDFLTGYHEDIDLGGVERMSRRLEVHRERERERDTTRGILDLSDTDVNDGKLVMQGKQFSFTEQKKMEMKKKIALERKRRQATRSFPTPLNQTQ